MSVSISAGMHMQRFLFQNFLNIPLFCYFFSLITNPIKSPNLSSTPTINTEN